MQAPIHATIRERWRFFHEHDGWATPPGKAACALSSAKAEAQLVDDEDVYFAWELCDLPWDGDAPPPESLWDVVLYQRCECCGGARPLASLHSIAFDAPDPYGHPYARCVEASLYEEAACA